MSPTCRRRVLYDDQISQDSAVSTNGCGLERSWISRSDVRSRGVGGGKGRAGEVQAMTAAMKGCRACRRILMRRGGDSQQDGRLWDADAARRGGD